MNNLINQYIYIYLYVCMYVCIYIYIYIYTRIINEHKQTNKQHQTTTIKEELLRVSNEQRN